jgi:hypothetical protein
MVRGDGEADDLARLVAIHAQIAVRTRLLRRPTDMKSAINYLINKAHRSPEVLLDARDVLGEQDEEARALLYIAAEIASHPVEPERRP